MTESAPPRPRRRIGKILLGGLVIVALLAGLTA